MEYIDLHDEKWIPLPTEDKAPLFHWHDNCGTYLTFNLEPQYNFSNLETDINKVRLEKREHLASMDFGLIECNFEQIDGIQCLATIAKHMESLPRAVYMSEIIIQLPKAKAAFCMRAQEQGTTGERETFALLEKLKRHKDRDDIEKIAKSMIYDRYFPHLGGHSLYCESDSESFDELFPDHPLTIVRAKTRSLLQTTTLSHEFISKLSGEQKPWWRIW